MRYIYFLSYWGKIEAGFIANAQTLHGNTEVVLDHPIDSMDVVRSVELSLRDQLASQYPRLIPESLAIMGFTLLREEK